jgi:hypothetical protein
VLNSFESTKYIRLRFAGLPMSILRDLMPCEDVGSVAWFVHEFMERVDNRHAGSVEDNNVTMTLTMSSATIITTTNSSKTGAQHRKANYHTIAACIAINRVTVTKNNDTTIIVQ